MTVLIISTVAAWGMVGVIWTMQLVHYPMLAAISELLPGTAAQRHQRNVTWVVGPLMAAEGVTSLILLFDRPDTMSALAAWTAAILLGVALLSTVLLQVPLHGRLAEGHDADAARKLITTNWIRTVAWTARGLVLAFALGL
ncbi:MAG: hypothetical protein HKN94_09875 [Acidimicrobiales bacterium]|nr:hypothetical protein [Acidimicrobiales bacterium]RZV48315.1 MAG: hypothetical protein EX269_02285 [Acidimicrobiales bacterium]